MSTPLKVMLVGEGKNELGAWVHAAPYRASRDVRDREHPAERGVLEALLHRVAPEGWSVVAAKTWASLVQLKPRPAGDGDARNLAAVLLHAKEQRCDVVVFSRDRDGRKNRARQDAIEALVAESAQANGPLKVVGAVAVETLEAWVLAFDGDARCEEHTDPVTTLCARTSMRPKDTGAMLAIVADETRSLDEAVTRSPSLARWVGHARRVFAAA